MNTTVKSLQDTYVALGGSLTDTYETIADGVAVSNYVTIPDVIAAIALKAATVATAATANELPSVSSSDNGKVLTVVSGKWAKADLPD